MKKLRCCLLLLPLLFTACSDDGDGGDGGLHNAIVGTWTAYKAEAEGVEVAVPSNSSVLTFFANGTYKEGQPDGTATGSWTLSGGGRKLLVNDRGAGKMTFDVKKLTDDELILGTKYSLEGLKFYLTAYYTKSSHRMISPAASVLPQQLLGTLGSAAGTRCKEAAAANAQTGNQTDKSKSKNHE